MNKLGVRGERWACPTHNSAAQAIDYGINMSNTQRAYDGGRKNFYGEIVHQTQLSLLLSLATLSACTAFGGKVSGLREMRDVARVTTLLRFTKSLASSVLGVNRVIVGSFGR